jgi:hypothetical protein
MATKSNSRYIRRNLYQRVPTNKFSVIERQSVGNFIQAQIDDNQQDDNGDYDMMEEHPDQLPDRLQQEAMEDVVFALKEIALDRQTLEDLEKDIRSVQPRLDQFYKFPHVNVLVSI